MTKAVVRVKTLTIDGREVGAREDQTVLDVARENGIFIPTLCELPGLTSVGACRLCLVEVKGVPRLLPACVTRVAEGMEVTVNSERLDRYRRGILELLFAERVHVCSVCVTNGHCDLQSLALKLGMTHVHFPYRYPRLPVDASHERFVVDHNRCVLVHPLRAGMRRDRGSPHVGRHVARRRLPRDHRPGAALGRFGKLHRVRQVRPGVSHRRALGEREIGRRDVETKAIPALPDADAGGTPVSEHKIRLATVWLDGCSGCHMSLLDTDERLIELARHVEVVWGPLVDSKDFPTDVDVTLVEGAISSEEDVHRIKLVRPRTKILVSLGDCAVTGNVPAMRNKFGPDAVLRRAYLENVTSDAQIPREIIPALLPMTRPVHEFVPVDVFVPGCPPSADLIFQVLSQLLEGNTASPAAKFG